MKTVALFTVVTVIYLTNAKQLTWMLPLDKTKINYHHQVLCITINGEVNCVKKNMSPPDPEEVAKLFKIAETYETSHMTPEESSGDRETDKGKNGSDEERSLGRDNAGYREYDERNDDYRAGDENDSEDDTGLQAIEDDDKTGLDDDYGAVNDERADVGDENDDNGAANYVDDDKTGVEDRDYNEDN